MEMDRDDALIISINQLPVPRFAFPFFIQRAVIPLPPPIMPPDPMRD